MSFALGLRPEFRFLNGLLALWLFFELFQLFQCHLFCLGTTQHLHILNALTNAL